MTGQIELFSHNLLELKLALNDEYLVLIKPEIYLMEILVQLN